MFEFRLRILDVREGDAGPNSFLGIVEGLPEILVHTTSAEQAEADLMRALVDPLQRLRDRGASRIDWDDFPTVRIMRVYLVPNVG